MNRIDARALAYLTGTSLFYGLLIVVQKMGLNSGLDPLSFSFYRSLIVLFIAILFFSPQFSRIRDMPSQHLKGVLTLGGISAAGILVLMIGQDHTTAVNAGFLVRLTPVFVLPLSCLLLGERHRRLSILFMVIMLAGAFFLTTRGALIAPHPGDVIVVTAALIIGSQNVYAKRLMQDISAEIVIFFRLVGSAVFILILVPALTHDRWEMLFAGADYALIAGVLYFLSVICHYRAINLVGPFLATTFFLSGSLFSALFAYILLGETLSAIQWAGALTIIVGGMLLVRNTNQASPGEKV